MRIFTFGLLLIALLASRATLAGVVNGNVTLLENGQPAVGATVEIYQFFGFNQVLIDQASIDGSGSYSLSAPNSGTFNLFVTLSGRVSERRGFQGSANPLNFDLTLSLPSSINVTVRDAISLSPVPDATVDFYRNTLYLNSTVTDASGIATLAGIPGDNYIVCVVNANDPYLNECNGNQHLPLGNSTQGIAPFVLIGGENLALTFDLDAAGASVTGTLTDRYRSVPIARPMEFELFDVNGVRLDQARLSPDALGNYTLRGLAPGTFFVRASGSGNNFYTPRVFPDLNCVSGCDVTQGSSISVTGNASVANIDFSLHPGSVVTGRVTEAGSGIGLPNVPVMAGGSLLFVGWAPIAQTTTGSDGSYTLAHIGPTLSQQIRLGAQGLSTHINLSWPSTPCYSSACFDGNTQTIARDEVRGGYDFQLTPAASFSGSVLAQSNAQSLNATLIFQNESGTINGVFLKDATAATYRSPGLPPGSYFAYASRFAGSVQQCQVFDGLPCGSPQPIDPATATPIVIGSSGVVTGVDFELVGDGVFQNGFEF